MCGFTSGCISSFLCIVFLYICGVYDICLCLKPTPFHMISLQPSICCCNCSYFIRFSAEPELEPGTAWFQTSYGATYVVWVLLSSLLRRLFSGEQSHSDFYTQLYSEKKSLILWETDFRYQQTGRGGGEENLHPDPEVTEAESPNSWDPNRPLSPESNFPMLW